MRLVLHIGTEKTGTTLLQEWLYHNRDALSEAGYFLSQKIGKPCNRDIVSFFRTKPDDFWNRHNLRSPADKHRFFANFLENFSDEIRMASTTHHTAIISSEHFHSRLVDEEDIAEFFSFARTLFDNIRILCYLRPQWAVRKSLYSTGLKAGTTVELNDFDADLSAENVYYNYHRLYHRWGDCFGFDALDFRIYDRSEFKSHDLRLDFLSAIGCVEGYENLDFTVDSSNESVSLLLGHALIGINKAIPLFADGGIDFRNLFFKSIVMGVEEIRTGDFFDTKAQEIYEIFRESNSRLAIEAFGRDQLFPAPSVEINRERMYSTREVSAMIEALAHDFTIHASKQILFDEDANVLRDVALKRETNKPVSKAEGMQLMKIAARARPSGDFIRRKLRQWTDQV